MVRRNERGFTLIEMAIVLVIIGIIIGGILKGKELIDSAKVKKAAADMNAVTAAYYGYVDRYSRVPGDDGPLATLTARGGSWAGVTLAGNNNGLLEVTAAQVFTGAGEGAGFFQHLRAAGLLTGDHTATGAAALPRNSFNGLVGVTNALVMGNLAGNKVCMSEVPGKVAIALDTQLDDGNPQTGSLRATQGVAGGNTIPGATATAYNEDNVYTICKTM